MKILTDYDLGDTILYEGEFHEVCEIRVAVHDDLTISQYYTLDNEKICLIEGAVLWKN